MAEQNQIPKEVYVSLTSPIDDQLVQKIVNNFTFAINNGIQTVHLFMHCIGGSIPASFSIYNFLSNIPINLIVYNGGYVASSGVIIFLAGKVRKASPNATFLLHRAVFYPPNASPMTAEFLKTRLESIERDNGNVETVWKKHIAISDSDLEIIKTSDLVFGVDKAKSIKLIHEIGDFVLPPGNKLFNVEAQV